MSELPVSVSGSNAVPMARPGMLARAGATATRLWDRGREGLADGVEAAGNAAQTIHRRLMLVILSLFALLLLGAAFRAAGWPEGNYLLVAVAGLAALFALLSPLHLVGTLLVGGGVAAARGFDTAGSVLTGYARLLGQAFFAALAPLFVFALAPGDYGFWSAVQLVLLWPVALLAIWLLGRAAPKWERGVLLLLPLGALAIALLNLLVPERTLAAIGIPAWLRADRPQDAELARLERAVEEQRNRARAEQLRVIRQKVERGESLSADDQAAILAAQRDRITLTGWASAQWATLVERVGENVAQARGAVVQPLPTTPQPGRIDAPRRGWSATVTVPAGYRICTLSDRGERGYVTQCHLTGEATGQWHRRASGRCVAGAVDQVRFQGQRGTASVSYRFVDSATACPGD